MTDVPVQSNSMKLRERLPSNASSPAHSEEFIAAIFDSASSVDEHADTQKQQEEYAQISRDANSREGGAANLTMEATSSNILLAAVSPAQEDEHDNEPIQNDNPHSVNGVSSESESSGSRFVSSAVVN